MNRLFSISFFVYFLLLFSCKTFPKYTYDVSIENIEKLDYKNLDLWAAHPEKEDAADLQPGKEILADQENLAVDVFFIHPTTYWNDKEFDLWNAPIDLKKLNNKTDRSTIKYQASIFNTVGKIYAPRYRQAHLQVYLTKDSISANKALEIAYNDIEDAFQYYLDNFNKGRPFIIASHSQGTTHAGPLMKKFIDGKPLQEQLVAAYVVGLPVPLDYFENIKPCEQADETECIISWRTFKKGSKPKKHWLVDYQSLNTNPLTWRIDGQYAEAKLNKGGIMKNFDQKLPNLVDAQAYDNFLWTKKPKFPLSFLFRQTNYHIVDYNLFYFNIQENAELRVEKYLRNN